MNTLMFNKTLRRYFEKIKNVDIIRPLFYMFSMEVKEQSIDFCEREEVFEDIPSQKFLSQMQNTFHRLLENLMVAPVWEGVFVLGGESLPFTYEHSELLALSCVFLLLGREGIAIELEVKKRLENICQKRGYSDWAFRFTVGAWCDEHVAKMVAKKHGHLEEYLKLCEKEK